MPTSPPDRFATVWSSTFVPAPSPFPELGNDGCSVAWVDTAEGRLQVLVDGPRPAPGTAGRLVERTLDGFSTDVFTADAP